MQSTPDIKRKLWELEGFTTAKVQLKTDGEKLLFAELWPLENQTREERGENRSGEKERNIWERTTVPIVSRRVTGRMNVVTEKKKRRATQSYS